MADASLDAEPAPFWRSGARRNVRGGDPCGSRGDRRGALHARPRRYLHGRLPEVETRGPIAVRRVRSRALHALEGTPITDELIEEYVAEAERGYDLDKLEIVHGRPLTGSAPAKSFPVRLDPELRAALDERANHDGRPASEIVREALRKYLEAS